MNIDNFNFIGEYPTDMSSYFYHGTVNVPPFVGLFDSPLTFNIPHTESIKFVPSIRYSIDGGTTWYQDGDSNYYWYAQGQQYIPDVLMEAMSNDNNTIVSVSNGAYTRNNVIYEIYGIKANV